MLFHRRFVWWWMIWTSHLCVFGLYLNNGRILVLLFNSNNVSFSCSQNLLFCMLLEFNFLPAEFAPGLWTGHSLVYEVDVRTPHLVGRNPQNINVIIFLWRPRQPVVWPCLGGRKCKENEVNNMHIGADKRCPDVPVIYMVASPIFDKSFKAPWSRHKRAHTPLSQTLKPSGILIREGEGQKWKSEPENERDKARNNLRL